ncbi:MAG: type I phosphomannose isomerase catalytic subunit [Bacteroidales bacterium]
MMYPLKFNPILKSLIWGGDRIAPFKQIETDQKNIGESWEVSQVKGEVSVISNGELAGQSLSDVIHNYKADLLGKKVYAKFGEDFPLLIKFIDAKDNLSIQVHPDDELAKIRHDSFGKTEMWYVMDATPDAKILCGFTEVITPEQYVQKVNDNTIMDVIKSHDAKAGQIFYLPAGRIHAIGAGSFVAEIQQTSNITYRIYDFDRRDAQGNPRELHTELAKDALDYTVLDNYLSDYETKVNEVNQVVESPYFTTNVLNLTDAIHINNLSKDSFVIYICMGGSATIVDLNGVKTTIHQGETVLVPAILADVEIIPNGSCNLMETFIG